ncbi:protein ROLLING AND ERECT LEAF 2-like [Phragmites australis]|uniref:protein ROLLING AND ERECT LEAF 2-like n=1 Tax=Phragmites australis TaxID=29695 RepID=UPI002D76BDF3|nr:protein ROLLING AND ERECT LEAF 2-like [Phragmites australis]
MGCKGSKLDDQEAVALCRGRADLLAAAVRHRYALADAHAALAESIESVAGLLDHLLRLADSPGLTLPTARKGGATANWLPRSFDPSQPPSHGRSSHLQYGSSSGSESASPADSPPRRVPEQPSHPHYTYGYGYAPQPAYAYPAPGGSLQFYYARSRPPPASVAVAQRAPGPPERVYFGSFDAAGGYMQYHAYGAQQAPAAPQLTTAPPSPPKASSWDFLNVFENYDSYDNYYYDSAAAAAAAYTPSRSSREVREEEGIPELEEDEEDGVVVKEVSGEYSAPGSGGARSRRSSVGGVSSIDEPGNVVAHKDVMGESRRRPPADRNVTVPAPVPPTQRVFGNADVAGGIKAQLVRAAEAARQLAPLLEVGRPSYQGRSSVYHSSSRMMSSITVSHLGCKDVDLLDVGLVEKVVDSWSLSLVLEKLYFWERKLYGEVKAEEKMRLLIAKKSKRLKLLDQRGAEAQKIDATRNLLRKLSTKIRITLRVIAKISRKINKVRDEELWPQLNALIQGFVLMWQDKLDSYHIQCQVMSELKNLTSVELGASGRDLVMDLELELIKWIISFSSWVNSQRNFVKALDGWLALCLNYEPEEAGNGVPSYSPGRIGAPLVFVVCNKWSQVMDRISEKDVVNAMQALVSSVRHLWEQQHLEQSEQIIAIREREKWIKTLDRKTQELNKEADELNRKLALVPSRQSLHVPRTVQLYEAHCVEASNLNINLTLVLQALENFAANSLQAFQEILSCAERARLPRDNVRARKPSHE